MLYQKKKNKYKKMLFVGILACAMGLGGCGNDGSAVILGNTELSSDNITSVGRDDEGIVTGADIDPADGTVTSQSESVQVSVTEAMIWIHICGQVYAPGVYELSEGSRVWDVVEMAGGLTEYAEPEAVNLALPLADGCKITIPARGRSSEEMTDWYQIGTGNAGQDIFGSGSSQTDISGMVTASGLVDINRADVATLMTVPGIGQVRAEAIVAYREAQGPFGSIEEIMQVTGIKEGLFAQIREHITVGG